MRLDGASTLPIHDEADLDIQAYAKHLLATGVAHDMQSAMMMAREHANRARQSVSRDVEASSQRGAGAAASRNASRAQAQGVVPMDAETGADVRARNRPLDQQEMNLGYQQETADRVTRGLRDGTANTPGSDAWHAESEHNYAVDHGIDEPGDAEIVGYLARRLGRDPRPEEVADEKKWRGWVNEEPGSERQARYNPEGYDQWHGEMQDINRKADEADKRKYGAPVGTRVFNKDTGEWEYVGAKNLDDLTDEQKQARQDRAASEARVRNHQTYVDQRRGRLADRAGISDAEVDRIVADAEKNKQDPDAVLRKIGNSVRRENMLGRMERRAFRTELAGGSQNINGSNAHVYAGLSMLPPEQRLRALMYSGPGGALAAHVDAAHNKQLTDLGLRVAQGRGFQDMNPAEQAAVQARIDQLNSQKPAIEQLHAYRNRPEIHDAELKYADQYVHDNHSWRSGWGTRFTTAEVKDTIDHLVNDLGYDPAKAQKIVDHIIRQRTSVRSGPEAAVSAPPSAPSPGPGAGEMPPVSI